MNKIKYRELCKLWRAHGDCCRTWYATGSQERQLLQRLIYLRDTPDLLEQRAAYVACDREQHLPAHYYFWLNERGNPVRVRPQAYRTLCSVALNPEN